MQQSDLNNNWVQTILYYCYITASGRMYDMNGVTVGTWGYDENNDLYIVSWLPNDITQPDNTTLLSYDLSTVQEFYNGHYLNPTLISEANTYWRVHLTSSQIAALDNDLGVIKNDYLIYNDTTNKLMRWDSGTNAFVNAF